MSAASTKRLHADDGVVAEVVRLAQLPELHAQREQAPGDARGELLRACMQRDVAHGLRGGLDDAGARVGFHELGEGDDALAAHHAVGVEHHHVAVILAPAAAEVGHVAGLAVRAARAQAVVHLHLGAAGVLRALGGESRAQLLPGGALGGGDLRVGGVGQHEHVERAAVARGRHRFAGGAQPGKDGGHVLVADWHDDGGARIGAQAVAGHAARRQRVRVAAQHHPGAHDGGGEAAHHPGGQQREQRQLAVFEPGAVVGGLHLREQGGGRRAAQQREGQKHLPAPLRGVLPGCARGGVAGSGLAAGQAHQQCGADAVPEPPPRLRRHGAAVHGRRGDGVGVALFAQQAAPRNHGARIAGAPACHGGGMVGPGVLRAGRR
jgi:hypothetical protein